MVFKDFIFQNLYYFICGVSLLSALVTYLYFYNREVLSFSSEEKAEVETVLELDSKRNKETIVVDLSGAVDRPGIYSLKPGDRLAELISLSGGVTNEVSEKWLSRNLNLSMILKDQQKIYIPFEWEIAPEEPKYEIKELLTDEPGDAVTIVTSEPAELSDTSSLKDSAEGVNKGVEGADINSPETLVNLNTATRDELIELPRVGEVTADKIIDNRPYSNIEEVAEKTDIYDSTLEKIRNLITF